MRRSWNPGSWLRVEHDHSSHIAVARRKRVAGACNDPTLAPKIWEHWMGSRGNGREEPIRLGVGAHSEYEEMERRMTSDSPRITSRVPSTLLRWTDSGASPRMRGAFARAAGAMHGEPAARPGPSGRIALEPV